MVGRWMNGGLERIWKEAIVVWPRYYPCIFLEELRQTTNNFPIRIVGVPAEIRTEHLPTTDLERYF
jgi:hypothetical protein